MSPGPNTPVDHALQDPQTVMRQILAGAEAAGKDDLGQTEEAVRAALKPRPGPPRLTLGRPGFAHVRVSSQMVTGPSLIRRTAMRAANRPVCTGTPCPAS